MLKRNNLVLLGCILQSFVVNAQVKDAELIEDYEAEVLYHKENGNLDSAIVYVDKLITLSGAISINKRLSFQRLKMDTYLHFDQISDAYEIGTHIIQNYCTITMVDCEECSGFFRLQSDLLLRIKDYNSALNYLLMDCRTNEPIIYLKIAGIYTNMNNYEMAFDIIDMLKLQNYAPKAEVTKLFGIGILQQRLGERELALATYFKTLELIDDTGVRVDLRPTVLGNIGLIYWRKGDFSIAEKYLKLDSEGSFENKNYNSYSAVEFFLTKIALEKSDYQTALSKGENLLDNYQANLSLDQILELFDIIAEAYLETGNTERYYTVMLRKGVFLQEEYKNDIADYNVLIQRFSLNSVQIVRKKMELDKALLTKKMEISKQQERQAVIRNTIGTITFGLILLVGYFWFRKYKSENKKKAQLKDAQLQLAEKEKKILSLIVREEKRNVQELSLELGVKSDFISSIRKELKKIENLTSVERRNLEIFVQTELGIKSIRADLQVTIEKTEGKFISALKITHANLTDNDLRLALLIVLKHSNKEIAIKKNISVDSVKVAKNRLKKKLALQAQDDLFEYLRALLQG